MRCPSCNADTVLTLDSRPVDNGRQRRRKCSGCGAQWRTMEAVVEGSLSVPRPVRPEPAWWAEARALQDQKLTLAEIGRRLGHDVRIIKYALRPAVRRRKKLVIQRWISDQDVRDARQIKQRMWRAARAEKQVGTVRTVCREDRAE